MRGGVFLQFAAEVPKLIVDQVFGLTSPGPGNLVYNLVYFPYNNNK